MEGFNTCYEVAAWLNNADSLGATDEDFAEMFAILDFLRNGRRMPLMYDADQMILNMDVDGLCKHLKDVLTEIQNNIAEQLEEQK